MSNDNVTYQPASDEPIIYCRLCKDPAVGIYHMPEGCACAPDPVQALCAQHRQCAEPLAGMWPVVEGEKDVTG